MQVHYDGWSARWDEWVLADKVMTKEQQVSSLHSTVALHFFLSTKLFPRWPWLMPLVVGQGEEADRGELSSAPSGKPKRSSGAGCGECRAWHYPPMGGLMFPQAIPLKMLAARV